jgi:hypothetical protein
VRGWSVHDVGSRSGDRDVAQDTAARNTSSQPLRSLIARVQTRQSRCASGRSDSPLIRGSTITKRMSRPLGRGAEPTSSMLFLPPMAARRLRCAAAACAPNSIHSPTCQNLNIIFSVLGPGTYETPEVSIRVGGRGWAPGTYPLWLWRSEIGCSDATARRVVGGRDRPPRGPGCRINPTGSLRDHDIRALHQRSRAA